ncbi:sugar phosphate isomerase/epimerase family protein [Fontivita pretiosa]|uniref:sugar phosphate isomerase/epimerase family protein n=1 Tax=Fontivita pretiosa TaxID=2989684 RepID=UPI003D162E30
MKLLRERLGIVASALGEDPHEAPLLSRRAGFRGLLFDVWSANLAVPELSFTGRREFRRLLASHQQQLIGLRMDLGPRGLAPGADVDRQISRIDRAMEAAAGLESPLVCVDVGPLPAPAMVSQPRPTMRAESIRPEQAGLIIIPTPEQIAELQPPPAPAAGAPEPAFVSQVNAALAEIGRRADRYSVTVAFSSSLAGFAALHEALSAAACPWFGVDLDPVAMLRDEWSADQIFSAVGPLVRHVRARDALLGQDRRTRPAMIGQGDIDWQQLLSLLDDAGYSGWISIDPIELTDRLAAASQAAKYLRAAAGR